MSYVLGKCFSVFHVLEQKTIYTYVCRHIDTDAHRVTYIHAHTDIQICKHVDTYAHKRFLRGLSELFANSFDKLLNSRVKTMVSYRNRPTEIC